MGSYSKRLTQEGIEALEKGEYKESFECFKQAALDGNGNAMCYLAKAYYYGKGVEKDWTQSRKWMKQAADLGVEEAKEFMAERFDCGDKTKAAPKETTKVKTQQEKDDEEYEEWLKKETRNVKVANAVLDVMNFFLRF